MNVKTVMTTDEKLNYVREHWSQLKKHNMLEVAIQKILDTDDWLRQNYSVQDVIDIEESMPEYLK